MKLILKIGVKMNYFRILNKIVICFIFIGFLISCKTGTQSTNSMILGQIQATNPDEETIGGGPKKLDSMISSESAKI
jgi:hypothetical protein